MADIQGLGAIVAEMRHERQWTLKDLAKHSGLSVSYLSDIERGRTVPSMGTIDKLAAVMEVEPGELLNVANTLTPGEYKLLEAWRSGDWSRLLAMVSTRMAAGQDTD